MRHLVRCDCVGDAVNKYLELLPIVADREWRIWQDGFIRDKDGCCPLCALVNEIDPTSERRFAGYAAALRDIGLRRSDASISIAYAADSKSSPLRLALMAALGMKT